MYAIFEGMNFDRILIEAKPPESIEPPGRPWVDATRRKIGPVCMVPVARHKEFKVLTFDDSHIAQFFIDKLNDETAKFMQAYVNEFTPREDIPDEQHD